MGFGTPSGSALLNHLRGCNELLSGIPNISLVENQTIKSGINTRVEKLPYESLSDGHEEIKTHTHLAKDQEDKLDKKLRKEWLSNGHGEKSKFLDNSSQQQDMFATVTDGEAHNQKGTAVATKDMVQFSPLQNNIADIGSGELGTPSAIISCDGLKNEKLPFVKCSPLWKSVESMCRRGG
ncbi:hypothetical protein POM88_026045 [Heracleum sosnowskyi]|uniref:Uncharacterized protein n=1 Tax=Heracleum sosnowskyi TaxID=360622 RepID=A0AAD8I674_9APIA|nr:hypothetical protein POM88_026045 [Heracleum sosnowskyi]